MSNVSYNLYNLKLTVLGVLFLSVCSNICSRGNSNYKSIHFQFKPYAIGKKVNCLTETEIAINTNRPARTSRLVNIPSLHTPYTYCSGTKLTNITATLTKQILSRHKTNKLYHITVTITK